ncbi:unknown [Bacteroides sp. CAG:927]|nr:unknown [Bacteroides sp. CAG:927]
MKKAIYILSALAMLMASCSTHRNMTVNNSLLIGTWEQPNVTLDLKANGHYDYLYKEDGYSNKQSGRYFADKDSVVLYGFYPQAYTPESKNERWTIRKLTSDSLTVYVHKATVVLNGNTLNTAGNETEIFTRKNDNK